ncbi:30S ribosomal protein S12 methylthiotransferase RimO [uncultured Prevotella sp.]|uniref:30S ribosomal protein S12 methylthiotransferase RimO n=1 Tax=uncultured Prevotella sp. TaxID=159272 RepID=UPI00261684EF|nr:30S ribosomal protein S12 methylthiotransferase RimO [uncultured Prevotella sp.]
MIHNQIDFITMGCSKNLVDTESLMSKFIEKGYTCTHDSDYPEGEIAVINTCGFIGDAKEESINMILKFAQAKEEGLLKKLYVMGCLSERYRKELEEEIPQVDKFYGKFDFKNLLEELGDADNAEDMVEGCFSNRRIITTPSHYAYVKISEGCDRRCAYCAIPLITGKHKSRRMEDIIEEVKSLVSLGVKEFQIIAQELTYYGIDLYGERRIAQLIDEIAKIDGVKWIRLHYAYPNQFPYELLDVMRKHDNVCKYLDIALQHISDHMLSAMHRNTTKKETYELVERMRKEVPGITLRTTLMVGFPGETDEDFKELVEFVKWARFERMGAFTYSEEEGTYSASHYEDDVPEDVKQERLGKLMRVQERISAEIEASFIGKKAKVIIDRLEGDYYIGRTQSSSPEVDPEVLIPSSAENPLVVGEFYEVEITGAEEFDVYAKIIDA